MRSNKPPLPEAMARTYDAKAIEEPLYDWWEDCGFFKPAPPNGQEPFVISMPPANVTGTLHLGHAIVASIEDALIRYNRMTGRPTLWVPGTDHAGLATQNVVERELATEGLSRHDLGRERFLKRVWAWKEASHARITEQHRRLGVSCDWDRERFTLDDGLSRAVREAFVRLYERELIYRGQYLINWCPRCTTAISDLEVEHEETQAQLWYVRYWAEDGQRSIVVATTRPETILGDSAVAVHPDDDRYKDMVGVQVRLPAVDRLIPIVADQAVDLEFGTGAVKVTPAHDPTDYDIGTRHGLRFINIMNDDATMNENAGPYAGQDRFECRKNLVRDLQAAGDLVKIEPHTHAVGHCERCHTIVEPRVSTQWFVRMKPLAEPAIEAVRSGRVRIVPARFEKIYFDWLENIRDWCISRQIWWGHRIPVWYCDDCGTEVCARTEPDRCPRCGSAHLRQDPDVLDTWFSSALWPFSSLGWPEETKDLAAYYPTSVLETGYDIIFFWVARMIMMGLAMTGQVPFHTVYLHGLIRNEEGKKISKSMVDAWRFDPLNIISQYGQDALRFTLLTGSTPGNDMRLSLSRVEANRNFGNKMWQAARYILRHLGEDADTFAPLPEPLAPTAFSDATDRWILSRYHRLVAESDPLVKAYNLGEAGRQIYDFVWGEFCDWYIEMSKVRLNGRDATRADDARRVLVYVLEGCLRLLHPYMPFVTEAIWQYLPHQGDALIVAPWPAAGALNERAEQDVDDLMELIRAIRNARAEYSVEPGRRIAATIAAGERATYVQDQSGVLAFLARIDEDRLQIAPDLVNKPDKALTLVIGGFECYLPLADMVDLNKELERLRGELADIDHEVARARSLLANEKFVAKAPRAVVQRERDKLAALQERRATIERRYTAIS